MKGIKPSSDNKMIYQISLSSKDLGSINPYLFAEKLQEEINSKIPSIKVRIIYHTKSESPNMVQLKCFCSAELPIYEADNLKQKIADIAFNLEHELNNKLIDICIY